MLDYFLSVAHEDSQVSQQRVIKGLGVNVLPAGLAIVGGCR